MKKVVRLVVLFAFTLSIISPFGWTDATPVSAESSVTFAVNQVAPNEGAIAKSLINQGKINPNATQVEIDAMVQQYLKTKLKVEPDSADADKRARVQAAKSKSYNEIGFRNFVDDKKHGVNIRKQEQEHISDVRPQQFPENPETGKLLVILADFDEDSGGPLFIDFPVPGPLDNSTMYVSDYSNNYYKKLLFSRGGFTAVDQNGMNLSLNSMNDYFLEQSQGKYGISGDVYGWYTLPHSEAYYGDDDPAGGNDNLAPGTPQNLVKDLMDIVAQDNSINLSDYDLEDLYDIDGDNNYKEADGIIDHLIIVHAGMDQSAGGGDQGDDAIWAHSSSVNYTVTSGGKEYTVMNYTIQGQDSAIGTFCHEYGHDLGLPDEYDTAYSGSGEPVGFWSIMASGSWLGQPLDSKPSSFSAWARFALGWITPTEVDVTSLKSRGIAYDIDEAVSFGSNTPAIKANLPDQTITIATPYQGSYIWYGGREDQIDNTMYIPLDLTASSSATNIDLNMALMYEIEDNWDFGFVQVSTDNGTTWTSLESETGLTTSAIVADGMPEIAANMPGYTGSTGGGWVNDTLDLTPYKGLNILLQIRYMTDWGTTYTGMFVDSLSVVVDGTVTLLEENAESGIGSWDVDGWTIMTGTEQKGHYYMLEWRNYKGSDETLKNCYQFVDSANGTIDTFRYEPGLVLWYRNKAYTENWTGVHPGYVFLGVVDAHPEPVLYKGSPLRTRLQIRDAAFNVDPVQAKTFVIGNDIIKLPKLPAVSAFSDNKPYWYQKTSDSGLLLPNYGFKFKVTGHSRDGSVGRVLLYR